MNKIFLLAIFSLIITCGYAQQLQQVTQELLAIYKEDQNIRHEFIAAMNQPTPSKKAIDSLAKIMHTKDSINVIKVSKILDSYGWLGPDKIGSTPNSTLFLVVQHSDLLTQQKFLPMLRKAVVSGAASKSELALLEDRVALREGRMQIYGSQIGQYHDTKKYYVQPLKDPRSVDIRRAEVGLQPLADYVKQWNIIWDPEEYIRQLPQIKELGGLK